MAMAIYDDIDEYHDLDEAGDVDAWNVRRNPTPRPPMVPIAIGGLLAIVLGVVAIDALRESPGTTPPPASAAAQPTDAVQPVVQAAAADPVAAQPAADLSAVPAAVDPAAAEVAPTVDIEGCVLDATSVREGDTGKSVECVQKALTATGFYTGAVDGTFDAEVAAAASTFQTAIGIYVDGVVGRQTASMLGIWPGDDSFVIRTPPPPAGAQDSMGFTLSSVATTGSDAPPMPPDTGQGTGKRIVYSKAGQRVWAVDKNEHVVRSYLVSGSQYNNELTGRHKVYSKSEMTTAWNGQADLPLMVRWLDTERGAIGFHQIPRHRSDGSLYQTEAELGTKLSGGCQRQTALDAQFMWYFADIGTPVYVVN
jgi:peptidoglycan hydrolase-like protein with peptidoglycan-binding domain